MFCSKCGAQNDNNAWRCVQCGQTLQGGSVATTSSGPPPASHVPNYLVQAILVTAFCCLPFGIVAIVYAAQVNTKLAAGDYYGALASSNSARKWVWISVVSVVAIWLLYIIFAILMGGFGLLSNTMHRRY